jgi:hypothetical protein
VQRDNSADRLNFANGTPVNVTGTYDVWAVSNIFFYVPKVKILGAKFAPFVAFPTIATGSLTLPFLGNGTTLGTLEPVRLLLGTWGHMVSAGDSGLALAAGRRLDRVCLCGPDGSLHSGRHE